MQKRTYKWWATLYESCTLLKSE